MQDENKEKALALTQNSQKAYGSKNQLLYFLDTGMLNHVSGRYKESNAAFEKAKIIFEENFTKSISAGVFSLFINDNVIPYYGEPYDIAYANVFCALNYSMLGMANEAAVEARQIDGLFKKISVDSAKAYYKDDGFVRYIMGLIYENAGYTNDAYISYKLALKAYKNGISSATVPDDLIDDLYTAAQNLGLYADADKIKSEYPKAKNTSLKNNGELIIVNYNGMSPKKVDNIIELAFYNAWPYFNQAEIANEDMEKASQVRSIVASGFSNDYIKVAFPKYYKFDNKIIYFEVKGNAGKSYAAQNISSMLENYLNNKITIIYARTVARAAGRYVLNKAVSKQVADNTKNESYGILANVLLNVGTSLLEQADKRTWRTLPADIQMERMSLTPGKHSLDVNFYGKNKRFIETKKIEADIKAGKKTFAVINSNK